MKKEFEVPTLEVSEFDYEGLMAQLNLPFGGDTGDGFIEL